MPIQELEELVPGTAVENWIASAHREAQRFDLAEDAPQAMGVLRAAGYTGECWVQARALTADESDVCDSAQALRREERNGEDGEAQVVMDQLRYWRQRYLHQIEDARLPYREADGTWAEYEWDRAKGRQNKNLEIMGKMGRHLVSWVRVRLRDVNGEAPEVLKAVQEAGN